MSGKAVTEEERLAFGAMIRAKMAEARAELERNPSAFDDVSEDVIAAAPIDEQILAMRSKG